jgi:hypothetical protein
MKSTILLILFFIGMVFGTTMMFFGNPYGDYLVVTSVVLGLYTMHLLDKESEKDEKSFF